MNTPTPIDTYKYKKLCCDNVKPRKKKDKKFNEKKVFKFGKKKGVCLNKDKKKRNM
tara:strand:+ start:116 stop:283 length:168 start_codon:yes stop_codon:yes gene_type:complete